MTADRYRGLREASRQRRRFTATSKYCSKCERWQPHDAFRSNRTAASGLASLCKPCQVEALWANDMRKKYGISAETYYAMFAAQDGRCAVCRCEPDRGPKLSVDHCHTTGQVRGLLCFSCNSALGLLGDDLDRVRQAVAYLERAEPVPMLPPNGDAAQPVEAARCR